MYTNLQYQHANVLSVFTVMPSIRDLQERLCLFVSGTTCSGNMKEADEAAGMNKMKINWSLGS